MFKKTETAMADARLFGVGGALVFSAACGYVCCIGFDRILYRVTLMRNTPTISGKLAI